MKNIFVIAFLLITSTFSSAQVREELNYYPLSVGNVWQYKISYFPEAGSDTVFYMSKKVIGDTIQSNGKKYFIVNQPPFTRRRFRETERVQIRIDSISGSVLKYVDITKREDQIDSLLASVDSPFHVKNNDSSYTRVGGYSMETDLLVLNEMRKVKTFVGPVMSGAGFYWRLAMNLGVFYQENWSAVVTAAGNKYNLIYAKINGKEYGTFVGVEEGDIIPGSYSLSQSYPNPFNPTTNIRYTLPTTGFVYLKVYDLVGREIQILVNEEKPVGTFEVTFDGKNLASGVYFYSLRAGSYKETKKFVLIR